MKIYYCNLKLNWNNAMDYANEKNMFIPSKEQAERLGLFKGAWTSTTYEKNNFKAWVTGDRTPAVKCRELKNIVLVEHLATSQQISYRLGDIISVNCKMGVLGTGNKKNNVRIK